MHKLESFALSCGSKISKPHIEKTFFPIVDKKFICVSQQSLSQAEDYDFIDDVIFHIKPYLDKEGIKIFEIGQSKKNQIFYSKSYSHLNVLQTSYLISNSLLYLGNLNLYTHLASYYGKPSVVPLNNQYSEIVRPYWSKEDECKLLTPDTDLKPYHSAQESPKTINQLQPEEVACAVLDSLSITHSLDKIETVHTGEDYLNQIIDIIPGPFDVSGMNLDGLINLRMDKVFDLKFLSRCSSIKKFNLVSRNIIPIEYLNLLKDKIESISFFIDNQTEQQDINILSSIGKPLNLLCEDVKNINEIRLKFIDYQVKIFGKKSKKDLNVKAYSDLKFISKKNIISNGQAYNSYLSLSVGENTSQVKNQKEFWEDLPFCRVFREKS
mgnify:CR=1 FL=1|jgi:hypothetical protein|tara:strand:+ start:2923 stop:4065 length:1143 start_codon:yes stop_codon:yes gene_type:complete